MPLHVFMQVWIQEQTMVINHGIICGSLTCLPTSGRSRWTQQGTFGDLPDPALAWGISGNFTIVNNHAYILTEGPLGADHMDVYELDLQTWHWRLLPHKGQGPCEVEHCAAAVVLVQPLCLLPLQPVCSPCNLSLPCLTALPNCPLWT